jgi:aminobenzoyl-glutamate utilization protein B
MPLNIVAALAVKKVMEREHLSGTIKLWPGYYWSKTKKQ